MSARTVLFDSIAFETQIKKIDRRIKAFTFGIIEFCTF